MDIKELREKTGLNQKDFAEKYKIPLGTLKNWEQGIRKPPAYVYYYLEVIIRNHFLEDNNN